jgi:excisionase family DNA binding protein
MVTDTRNERLLHVKECALELGVHPSSIRRAIRTGELEALQLGRRGHYRVRRSALEDFLQPVTREASGA